MKRNYTAAGAIALAAFSATPALAQDAHDHHAPPQQQPAPPPAADEPRAARRPFADGPFANGPLAGSATAAPASHAGHAMTGALGAYPMEREASGTAWQPDASEHMGLMSASGDWTLMGHGVLNLVYDRQSGPRGDDKAFASGHGHGHGAAPARQRHAAVQGDAQPRPADGQDAAIRCCWPAARRPTAIEHLIDRQHPHDFFMELSASLSQNIGPKSSVFLYGGLPGEPAFGPPAFMHREAIMDSPEAPISHHWLDSTHISFGVLTAAWCSTAPRSRSAASTRASPTSIAGTSKPRRWIRPRSGLSFNPTRSLSLQGSWGRFKDPEQLEPGVDQTRWSASALYAADVAPGWKLAGTLAWGRKTIDHHDESFDDDAFVAEASLKRSAWTFFGRGEMTENRELVEDEEHGPAYRVGKVSVGAVRDFRVAEHLALGVGGLVSVNFVPDGLAPLYGGSNPTGAMAFVRLKVQ